MPKFPITKAFQQNEFPLGSITINDEELEWITKALAEQSVEFACAFQGESRDHLRLIEVSIVPTGMHLQHRSPGVVILKGDSNE